MTFMIIAKFTMIRRTLSHFFSQEGDSNHGIFHSYSYINGNLQSCPLQVFQHSVVQFLHVYCLGFEPVSSWLGSTLWEQNYLLQPTDGKWWHNGDYIWFNSSMYLVWIWTCVIIIALSERSDLLQSKDGRWWQHADYMSLDCTFWYLQLSLPLVYM